MLMQSLASDLEREDRSFDAQADISARLEDCPHDPAGDASGPGISRFANFAIKEKTLMTNPVADRGVLHPAAVTGSASHRRPMGKRRTFLKALVTGLVSLVWVHGVSAQPAKYPAYPIKVIVPFAAGGGVDAFARLLGKQIEEKRGVTVVIENRAGANGTLGANGVLQSQPDGYTLLFSAATHVMARQVMSKVSFDPVTDFTPIARVGEAPMLVVMSPKMPQKTISEVVEDAKKNSSQWQFGVSAAGSPGHIATIAFNHLSGAKIAIVPYRGTAPARDRYHGRSRPTHD